MIRGIPLALLALLAVPARGAEPHPARAALLCDAFRALPGDTVRVGVLIRTDPGWHVYWRNPGDSGLPTKVSVTGAEAGELAWPLPHRFDEPGGIVAYGYEEAVLLARPVKLPATAGVGARLPLEVEASWLVCRERCLEGGYRGTGYLPVGPRREANREAFARWGGPLPEAGAPFVVEAGAGGEVAFRWQEPVEGVKVFPFPEGDTEVEVAFLEHADRRTRVRLKVESYGAAPGPVPLLVVFRDASGRDRGVEIRVEVPG